MTKLVKRFLSLLQSNAVGGLLFEPCCSCGSWVHECIRKVVHDLLFCLLELGNNFSVMFFWNLPYSCISSPHVRYIDRVCMQKWNDYFVFMHGKWCDWTVEWSTIWQKELVVKLGKNSFWTFVPKSEHSQCQTLEVRKLLHLWAGPPLAPTDKLQHLANSDSFKSLNTGVSPQFFLFRVSSQFLFHCRF